MLSRISTGRSRHMSNEEDPPARGSCRFYKALDALLQRSWPARGRWQRCQVFRHLRPAAPRSTVTVRNCRRKARLRARAGGPSALLRQCGGRAATQATAKCRWPPSQRSMTGCYPIRIASNRKHNEPPPGCCDRRLGSRRSCARRAVGGTVFSATDPQTPAGSSVGVRRWLYSWFFSHKCR